MAELLRVMREVDYAALKTTETAPDPSEKGCELEAERYIHNCRRVRELGLLRWAPDGPRVLDPDCANDLALARALFSAQ